VVEIDAASNRGVDDARELRERAMYAPSQAEHHKVYIVDEAHMLTREAWNALLKILEEPPPGVVFVFATTEPQKIANTAAPVMSRLQRFDFKRIGPAAIRDRLASVLAAEKLTADEDALLLISRHADGGMRDALSVLDQCLSFGGSHVAGDRVREVLGLADDELYAAALALVADANPGGVFPLVDQLVDSGADLTEFVGGLADVLRALLVTQLGGTPADLTERMEQTIATARTRLAPEDAVRMLRLLTETEAAVRRSANPRLALETLLLRWAVMARTVDLEMVLGRKDGMTEGRTETAAPRQAAPRVAAADRSAPPTGLTPSVVPSVRPSVSSPEFTVPGIQAIWPEVVDAGKQESLFLAQALAACSVVSADSPSVVVRLPADQAHMAQPIEKGRRAVEAFLQVRLGVPVNLTVESGPGAAPAERPRRMSDASLRSERLKGLRGTDPALDTAVDELDLEIVDERPPAGGR
jgi:DNA polymerase-3 subunit gamma/tau